MSERLLSVGLNLLGSAACLIGLLIFLLGPQQTADLFVAALSLLGPQPPLEGLADANTDSELRFYSVLWIAYGASAIYAASAVGARIRLSRGLLALFFAGGVGRLISVFDLGAPHTLFMVLMCVELVVPVLLAAVSLGVKAELGASAP
jgi:hypothetical protein